MLEIVALALCTLSSFKKIYVFIYLCFCNTVHFGHSRSSKVDDFGTNRNFVCDFLLVGHCNYGPILHRFWDTATYWLKIAYFCYPSLIRRPRSLCSLWNFALKLTVRKLESWGYLCTIWQWLFFVHLLIINCEQLSEMVWSAEAVRWINKEIEKLPKSPPVSVFCYLLLFYYLFTTMFINA